MPFKSFIRSGLTSGVFRAYLDEVNDEFCADFSNARAARVRRIKCLWLKCFPFWFLQFQVLAMRRNLHYQWMRNSTTLDLPLKCALALHFLVTQGEILCLRLISQWSLCHPHALSSTGYHGWANKGQLSITSTHETWYLIWGTQTSCSYHLSINRCCEVF